MFYDKFVMLCKKQGVSRTKACIDCGVSRTAWHKWENGTVPNGTTINKFAKYFGVSVGYLLGEEKAPTPEGERTSETAIKIPVLGSVPAGIPIEAIEDISDWEEIPAKMCSGGRTYFGLEVKGDSMWPDYLPGDVVIVRRSPVCDTGDVCVVYVNGYDATLKEVKFSENGDLTLIPHNQSYPPRTFSAEEVKSLPVAIAGVVVELRRKIK